MQPLRAQHRLTKGNLKFKLGRARAAARGAQFTLTPSRSEPRRPAGGAAPVLRLAVTPGQLNGHGCRPNSGRPLSAFICNGGPARCASDCGCRRRPGPAAARAARLWVVLHYIPYIEIVRRLLRNKAFVITIHGHCNK